MDGVDIYIRGNNAPIRPKMTHFTSFRSSVYTYETHFNVGKLGKLPFSGPRMINEANFSAETTENAQWNLSPLNLPTGFGEDCAPLSNNEENRTRLF